MSALTPIQARARIDAGKAAEREAERVCRRRFLTTPDHANCVCDPECSRDYDLTPCPDSEPWPPEMYLGTGIGALYGLQPMTAGETLSLAGWNITCGGES